MIDIFLGKQLEDTDAYLHNLCSEFFDNVLIKLYEMNVNIMNSDKYNSNRVSTDEYLALCIQFFEMHPKVEEGPLWDDKELFIHYMYKDLVYHFLHLHSKTSEILGFGTMQTSIPLSDELLKELKQKIKGEKT